ncbi:tachykinin-like peptides receptor 99D [Ctenocephalides felis]|uniref:tachykinin-like peptides receptor 99D n=1 Tax=Ctenocephalides felis TaxID=7515 RepID=UPI000E6E311A|nr:tachykinin-like peptides receptor 99D [Ctenocephalides felis]
MFNSTEINEDLLYQVPGSIIALLSVFYGSISVMSVAGNSLVIWIVATSRSMQSVINCFIANLALADIVIGLFAIPFQFQAALLQRWDLPEFMCAFCPYIQTLSVNVSVFTLTAIAIDRHRAIMTPLRARPSKSKAKVIITLIWLVSAVLASPIAIALKVEQVLDEEQNELGIMKKKPFCRNVRLDDNVLMVYRYLLVFLQYVTPLCIITCVYARMSLKLWGSRAPGNAQTLRDASLTRNKKKVIKMLVIVVALFALCWLPLQTYNLLQFAFPAVNEYKYINIVFFTCDWLAMSNSCYNPFIYGIYNDKFKREFRRRFLFRDQSYRFSSPGTDSFEHNKTNAQLNRVRSTYDWDRNTAQLTTACHVAAQDASTHQKHHHAAGIYHAKRIVSTPKLTNENPEDITIQ